MGRRSPGKTKRLHIKINNLGDSEERKRSRAHFGVGAFLVVYGGRNGQKEEKKILYGKKKEKRERKIIIIRF